MYQELSEVIYTEKLAADIFEMHLMSKNIASAALPGQFVHIRVNQSLHPLLRRPISIHSVDTSKGIVAIIYRLVGMGTEELSHVKPGELLDVMGPLGKSFPLSDKRCAVVGGGIGTAPLLELAKRLPVCDAYLGFRSEPYKIDAFAAHCKEVYVSTEDGSSGCKGYITDQLESQLTRYEAVYTCGPTALMQKVVELCNAHDIECYVSIEERMGCGIGACLVCACKVKEQNGDWHHKKACKDGPVFDGKEVVLDA